MHLQLVLVKNEMVSRYQYSMQILPLLLFVCGGGKVKRSFEKREISAIRGEQFYADMLKT